MKKLALFLTLVLSITASAQLKEPRLMMFNENLNDSKMFEYEIKDVLTANESLRSKMNNFRDTARSSEVKYLVGQIQTLTKAEVIFRVRVKKGNLLDSYYYITLTPTDKIFQIKRIQDFITSNFIAFYDKNDILRTLNKMLTQIKTDIKAKKEAANISKDFSKINSNTVPSNDI